MRIARALRTANPPCRPYSTAPRWRDVPVLPTANLETFRQQAFEPALPCLLPRQTYQSLPATRKWFRASPSNASICELNSTYLSRYTTTLVPLEITHAEKFARIQQPLGFFLECVAAASSTFRTTPSRYFSAYVPGARAVTRTKISNDFFSAAPATPPTAKVYLAQAEISHLPSGMRADLPIPEVVLGAGRGDVYASSIWIGAAPTYTSLHRDPNPNLFVQLAGKKVVRLLRPEVGRGVFARVQERVGGAGNEAMRGEEMMVGEEKSVLEEEVWGESDGEGRLKGWQAELGPGDGLFIPKGWWHSVKGIGEGVTGSVSRCGKYAFRTNC